jgi:hypothetical protein
VVLRGSGKELKDVWKTELLSLRGFELRIFFHVTHFDESKIQYHCPCSKYFTIILLSENFLKAISLELFLTDSVLTRKINKEGTDEIPGTDSLSATTKKYRVNDRGKIEELR